MSPFSRHSIFGRSWIISITPFSSREPSTTTKVFPLLRFYQWFQFVIISFLPKLLLPFCWQGSCCRCCCCSVLQWLLFWVFAFEMTRFQMSPSLIFSNGNINSKTEKVHSIFIWKRSNGNWVLWLFLVQRVSAKYFECDDSFPYKCSSAISEQN